MSMPCCGGRSGHTVACDITTGGGTTEERMKKLGLTDVEIEEDMLPENVCGNCLGEDDVQFHEESGRRLCGPCRSW